MSTENIKVTKITKNDFIYTITSNKVKDIVSVIKQWPNYEVIVYANDETHLGGRVNTIMVNHEEKEITIMN